MSLEFINDKIKKIVTQLTLPQAIRLSCINLRKFYLNEEFEDLYEKIIFKSNPSLSFPHCEVSKIEFIENEQRVKVEITLNFLGIFGSSSPMPTHLSEMVLNSLEKDKVLYDFLTLFNHHIQKFIYPIWEKNRYYIQYKNDLSDRFSKYILSFLGLHSQGIANKKLHLSKLIPYMGLLTMRYKSASTIRSVLRHYLDYDDINVNQCILSKFKIPSFQYANLGGNNVNLGKNFVIGNYVMNKNLKFQIVLNDVEQKELLSYSILGEKDKELKELISFILDEPLDYEVVLHIKKENKSTFVLSSESNNYLGVNSWIGTTHYDENIVLAQK